MDLIDRFGGGDIVFPDADGFCGSDCTRILDKPEGITASGGGTHDVGGREASIDQFDGRNRLDNGFTSAAAKNE